MNYVHGLEDTVLLNCQFSPSCSKVLILIPISSHFLNKTDKLILNFTWKYKGSGISKTTLNNNDREDLYYLTLKYMLKLQLMVTVKGLTKRSVEQKRAQFPFVQWTEFWQRCQYNLSGKRKFLSDTETTRSLNRGKEAWAPTPHYT